MGPSGSATAAASTPHSTHMRIVHGPCHRVAATAVTHHPKSLRCRCSTAHQGTLTTKAQHLQAFASEMCSSHNQQPSLFLRGISNPDVTAAQQHCSKAAVKAVGQCTAKPPAPHVVAQSTTSQPYMSCPAALLSDCCNLLHFSGPLAAHCACSLYMPRPCTPAAWPSYDTSSIGTLPASPWLYLHSSTTAQQHEVVSHG